MVLRNDGYYDDIKSYHMRQIKYIKNEKKNYYNTIDTKNIYDTNEDYTKLPDHLQHKANVVAFYSSPKGNNTSSSK